MNKIPTLRDNNRQRFIREFQTFNYKTRTFNSSHVEIFKNFCKTMENAHELKRTRLCFCPRLDEKCHKLFKVFPAVFFCA